MRYLACLFCITTLHFASAAYCAEEPFSAIISAPAPVFNAVQPAASPTPPKPDSCGQHRELEFIALPGTPVTVISKLRAGSSYVYQISTPAYKAPPGVKLYLSAERLDFRQQHAKHSAVITPKPDETVSRLKKSVGLPYVWGGNWASGITWRDGSTIFAGLDCSGLLYEATDGFTPRNSVDLLEFGKPVKVSGLTVYSIAERLKPLDLIVWNGHVIIVLDRESVIESELACSRAKRGGVKITPLDQRLREIMSTRKPLDRWPTGNGRHPAFVVRRWLD